MHSCKSTLYLVEALAIRGGTYVSEMQKERQHLLRISFWVEPISPQADSSLSWRVMAAFRAPPRMISERKGLLS